MDILENKEVTVNGNYYVITAMEAVEGMDFISKVFSNGGTIPPAKDIRQVIVKHVKLGGKQFSDKTYGIHFSRNYEELMQLFEEFMVFNFGEFNPNEDSDTLVEDDISEK